MLKKTEKLKESDRFKNRQMSATQAEQVANDYYKPRYQQFSDSGQMPSLKDCEDDYKKTGSHILFSLLFLELEKKKQERN